MALRITAPSAIRSLQIVATGAYRSGPSDRSARGYKIGANGKKYIQIFEVFNEADFTFGGATTWGSRKVTSKKMLNATKDNQFHNIGL